MVITERLRRCVGSSCSVRTSLVSLPWDWMFTVFLTDNPTKNNRSGFSIWPEKTSGASLTHRKTEGNFRKMSFSCCLVKSESCLTAPDITFPVLYALMAGCCAAASPPPCPVAPDVMVLIWAAVNPPRNWISCGGTGLHRSQCLLPVWSVQSLKTLPNVNKIQQPLREHLAEHALQLI